MKFPVQRHRTILGAVLAAAGLAAACASTATVDLDEAAAIARGGRLYDKWFAETGVPAPEARHPLYPEDAEYASKGSATWRCKECHGWDYLGRDGAYADGKHATGIPGIAAAAGKPPAEIADVLAAEPHGFGSHMSADDLRDLALFVSRGQVDMDAHIDRATRRPRGDAGRGAAHYRTLCAGCHGTDGRADDMPALGPLARKNPWETVHKVVNGQPNSAMPALRTLDLQVTLDIVRFAQTLPE